MTRFVLFAAFVVGAALPVGGSYIYTFSETWTQQQAPVTLGFSFKTPGLVPLAGDNTGDGDLWGSISASAFLTCDLSAFATPGDPFGPTCNSAGLAQGTDYALVALILNNAFGDPDTYTAAQVTFAGADLQTEGTWTATVPNLVNGFATLTVVDPIDVPEPATCLPFAFGLALLAPAVRRRLARRGNAV